MIFQRFGDFFGIFGLGVGDIEHRQLHRRQPGRQRACALFDQNSDKTLQAADNGAVQHDRPVAGAVFPHIFGVQALGHREIHLHGSTLPLAPDSVLERVLNLGAVKSTVTRGDFKFAARSAQAFHQRRFCLVPNRVAAYALRRSGSHFVNYVFETEIGVHLLQQRGVVDALLQDLVFGTKNMPVVLGEAAHPHDAVQTARGFIAVALAEFAVTQRQVAVAFDALLEDQDVAGAVHRLERVIALFRLGGEHVFAVFVPVAGFFPQTFVDDLRAFDFLVAIVLVDLAHVLLHALPQRPALGVPEHQARRMLVDMEQIQLTAEFAVVALFGFFQHGEVLLQVFFGSPSRTVNALQHFLGVVAAPIGSGQFHQLEVLELARAGHVGATAQVFEAAFAVERHILACRNGADDFGLVMLAHGFEVSHCLVTRQHATLHRLVFAGQFGHLLFDGGQVLGSKRPLKREVVKKAVFNNRADSHLGLGKQFFDGIRQQVGGGVPDNFQALCILGRDDGQLAVGPNGITGIYHYAIDLTCQRRFGQARADGRRHFSHGDGAGIFALGTVGKRNLNHGSWVRWQRARF